MTGGLGGTDGKGQQDLVEGLWTGTPAREGDMTGSTGTEKAERGTGDEEPSCEGSRANTKEKENTEMLFIKFVLPTLCSE